MNVLIVDDEIVQIESIGRGLRNRGYNVAFALNGEDALEKLCDENRRIDMVITDYAMPGINGLCLLKKIREKNRSMPVVMMTAFADKAIVIDAMRNRCNSFIEKPFTLDQLIQETERAKVHILQNTRTDELIEIIPKHIHQINNPLMAIVGSAELAIHPASDQKIIEKCIHRIIEAAEKISKINESLIKMDGEPEPAKEIIDPALLIDECLHMFKDLLTLKNITVKVDSADPVRIKADRYGLEQVLKNLILNAIDAMDGCDEKQLELQTAVDSKENIFRIRIKDSGCGMSENVLEKLFTPYFTNKRNGNGLGLAVVKTIVDKHHGGVSVRSRENNGTSFTITLPINATAVKAPVSLSSEPSRRMATS